MTKSPVKKESKLKFPVLRGKGGMHAGIDPESNASMLDAADGFTETAYLLAEPANAEHLRRSISQYRAGRMRVKER
ncbi:MAG TPA: hypothetical protein PLJ65_09430 [Casimicrobium sp.]|nr:hypothetical protein [Casimicrobium sp.]